MSDGTVRGTFDLNTDPSLRKLRDLRRAGAETETQMRSLGGTMDRIGGPTATRRLDDYRDHVRGVGRAAMESSVEVSRSWDAQRRTVDVQATRIEGRVDRLEQRVGRYGRQRASATVELNGAARVNAQLAELERRLSRLDRQRATPSVGLGGGFSNAVGGGGGGPVDSAAGGGGGGFGLGAKLAIGGAALAPGLQALGASSVGLLGSAAGATLGAATVYGGGAATLGVGGGLTYGVARGAIKELQELQKEQKKYTAAVERYGAQSKQAAVAREALSRAEGRERAAGVATRQLGLFRSQYRRDTAPARSAVFSTIGNVAVAGRAALPSLSRATNVSTAASGRAVSNFAGFLAGGQTQGTLLRLSSEYAHDLPMVERSMEHLTSTAEHLAVAARPFFREGIAWAEHWTGTLSRNSGNEARVQRTMRGLVTETKDWGRLAGATYRTIRDIFNMGRPSGDSMVVSLTHTLDRWDSWIQRNPGKVERFFREAETTTGKIAGALTSIVRLLSQTATALSPIFNRGMDLIKLAGMLGPTGTTAISALAYGGYGGFRSGARGLVGTAVLGRPGGLGGAATGTRIAGGTVATTATATRFLMPVTGGGTGRGVGAAGQLPLFATAGGNLIIAGAGRGSLGGGRVAATPEAFAARYGGVEGARYAAPVSELGSASRFGAVGARARGVLGGAGKTFATTMALVSGLEAAGKGGSTGQVLQNFASGISFGLIHGVNTNSEVGRERASRFLSNVSPRLTPGQQQAAIGRRISGILQQPFFDSKPGLLGFFHQPVGYSGSTALNSSSPAFMAQVTSTLGRLEHEGAGGGHTRNVVTEVKTLRKAWTEARDAAREARKAQNEALDVRSEQHALQIGSRLGGAFSVETHHGASPVNALTDVTGGALSAMRSMRETGRKVLGESTLAWARQLAKGNPQLEGVVQDVTDRIKRMWHNMGRDVQIVNGHILTGSKQEWGAISEAMTDPVEKARERMSKAFTAIQQEAIGSMMAMGFSRSDAQMAMREVERGHLSMSAVGSLSGAAGANAQSNNTINRRGAKHARGGVIGGRGLQDTVPVPGGMAAPGESWIANRHTMNDLSRATVAYYGKTAQQMIGSETRAHSMPMRYALGGASLTRAAAGGGALAGVRSGVRSVAEAILGQFPGLAVTSTTGGKHATGSLHYLGEAVDLAGGNSTMLSAASWTGRMFGRSLAEGIHNPNLSIKSGRSVPSSYWGEPTWAEHANHIHVGVIGGGGARGAALGYGGSQSVGRRIRLRGRSVGVGGIPGLMANRGIAGYTGLLQARLNERLGGSGAASTAGAGSGGSPSANEKLGRAMMIAAGWPSSEWPSLKALWTQESGWNANSVNSSSGAYGIPQALGHGHPFNLGDARAQIAWGLNYIRGRYGSPAGAEAHERSFNWYSRGGRMGWAGWNAKGGQFETRGPTLFGAGERGRERVKIEPLNSSKTGGGHRIEVNIYGGSFGSDAEVEKTAQKVAAKILDALDEVGHGESDRELMGR